MSTEQAFRDHEMRLMNPPVAELPGEICDLCGREIGNDFAMSVQIKAANYPVRYRSLVCDECAVRVDRCDQCGFLRCVCES